MDDFEDGDGFDEIYGAGDRQTPDEEFTPSCGRLPAINKAEPGSPVTAPPIRKLDDEYWEDHLSRDERRDVILRAKAGDPAAKNRFYRCFHKALRKIAGNIKLRGPAFDEKMSAARVGIFNALARYNDNHHNGFWAYARKFVEGAVVDYVHNCHRRGGKGETRAERKDRSRHRPVHIQYNGVECSHDQDGERIDGCVAADDSEARDWDESGTHLNLARRLAKLGRRLGVPRERIGVDGNPFRNGGRKKAVGPHGNAPPLGIIDYLAQATDHRDMHRLKTTGRKAYALRLWRRYVKPPQSLFHSGCGFGFEAPNFHPSEIEMAPYSIPINTAATASDSTDWKSPTERIAEGEAKNPPQVWDQKIQGVWKTIDHRPKNEILQPSAAEAAGRSNGYDRVRQNPGHEACGLRGASRDRRSNERSGSSGHDQHVGHIAASFVG